MNGYTLTADFDSLWRSFNVLKVKVTPILPQLNLEILVLFRIFFYSFIRLNIIILRPIFSSINGNN